MNGFWEWLGDNAWAGWLGLGLLLATAELLSLDLVLLMLAVGAFAGAGTAALGASVAVSAVIAIAVSLAMLLLARPSMVKRLHTGPDLKTGTKALVGASGVALSTVDATQGQVKLGGETWSARAFDPGVTIEEGTRVAVFEIDGATAVVYPEE
ncbi:MULTISPECIES: NfeD family protein [Mumia]|uniref:NfeD family protein n=1 Tax=Mumia TaxID=1546255 RepID=UPI00142171CD|nr:MULTISPECIES: NfeD family protein [unclassified Mumia]QMW64726.1 NfeD family protein [Mumia sp. ZJ1417]